MDPSGYYSCEPKLNAYKKRKQEEYNQRDANILADMDVIRKANLTGRTDIYAQLVGLERVTGTTMNEKQILAIVDEAKNNGYKKI